MANQQHIVEAKVRKLAKLHSQIIKTLDEAEETLQLTGGELTRSRHGWIAKVRAALSVDHPGINNPDDNFDAMIDRLLCGA